ncbi:MAG: hypothetical protein K8R36_22790 [Planctomycetales bacterium]|nr:hypothetical protein [Planctomycetales bacterium]
MNLLTNSELEPFALALSDEILSDVPSKFLVDPACAPALKNYLALTQGTAGNQLSPQDRVYNRYFWFQCFRHVAEETFGSDAGIDQQATQILEHAGCDLDWNVVERIEMSASQEWLLVDEYQPDFRRCGAEKVRILSEAQLGELLERLVRNKPRIVTLYGPHVVSLVVALGGPCAAVEVDQGVETARALRAIPAQQCGTGDLWFTIEGQPAKVEATASMRPDEAINIVKYFYRTQCLAEWVRWE